MLPVLWLRFVPLNSFSVVLRGGLCGVLAGRHDGWNGFVSPCFSLTSLPSSFSLFSSHYRARYCNSSHGHSAI